MKRMLFCLVFILLVCSVYADVGIVKEARQSCKHYCDSHLCDLFMNPNFPQPELQGKNCLDLGESCCICGGCEVSLCEPPRIMYNGECCLDADNSGECDVIEEALKRSRGVEEEVIEEIPLTEEVPPTELPLIEEVPPVEPRTQKGMGLNLSIGLLAIIGAIFVVYAIFSFSKKAGKKLKKSKNNCSNCGAQITSDDKYCPECGEKV